MNVVPAVFAENEAQHAHFARPPEQGGHDVDAMWNDDFHHSAAVALTGHNEAYYTDYGGRAQEFVAAVASLLGRTGGEA